MPSSVARCLLVIRSTIKSFFLFGVFGLKRMFVKYLNLGCLNGHKTLCQSTPPKLSVTVSNGAVAQRGNATIYYRELTHQAGISGLFPTYIKGLQQAVTGNVQKQILL